MANSSVRGRVVDERGAGIADLVVGAFHVGLFGEKLLRNTSNPTDLVFSQYGRTGTDGSFSIRYKPGTYDLFVRVYDTVKRRLTLSSIAHDVDEDLYELPDELFVMRDAVEGRIATSGQFSQPIAGNVAEPIIDNHDAWQQILASVKAAKKSIDWMLFYLDVDWLFMTFDPDPPVVGQPTAGGRLENALRTAGENGVKVRLGCNQLYAIVKGIRVPLPWPVGTAALVEKAMRGVPNAEARRLWTWATAPIHAKFVVIDNELAYVVGSPFVADYYDDHGHKIEGPRHGRHTMATAIKVPVHEVSVRLRGPAIGPLNETFALHWNAAKPDVPPSPVPPAPGVPSDPGPKSTLQVVRSLAGGRRWSGFPYGEMAILESYLRAIRNATRYVYLENQYFTEEQIADALVLRLQQAPGLEVIFLTNNAVDIPGYAKWQPQTIQRVLDGLDWQERRRVGFFTTWSHEQPVAPETKTTICRNYIHSKVAIIDDNWATVGSANLDGASLTYSQNPVKSPTGPWLQYLGKWRGDVYLYPPDSVEENRETEVNLTTLDGVDGGTPTGYVARLRKLLWAEHLGFSAGGHPDPNAEPLEERPGRSFLHLWNQRAEAKLQKLRADPITVDPAKVLRYPEKGDPPRIPSKVAAPDKYLTEVGVDVEKLIVRETFRPFDWATGQWEEWD